jgi:hypothetical protein
MIPNELKLSGRMNRQENIFFASVNKNLLPDG